MKVTSTDTAAEKKRHDNSLNGKVNRWKDAGRKRHRLWIVDLHLAEFRIITPIAYLHVAFKGFDIRTLENVRGMELAVGISRKPMQLWAWHWKRLRIIDPYDYRKKYA